MSRPAARLDPPEATGDGVRFGLSVGEETSVFSYTCRDGALDLNPDAGFAAALPVAMGLASTLDAPDGVSARLLEASGSIQRLLAAWDRGLQAVEVRSGAETGSAGEAAEEPTRGGKEAVRGTEEGQRGTAAFFTGGVDSFYTVLTRSHEIDALVYVHGFDLPLEEEQKGELVSASLRDVARELGLPLIEIETDLRAVSDRACSWELAYTGAALASVGHLLASRFERILIPATHSFRDLHPIGTHPLLDPLYSSERLRFEHVNSVTRVDKLAYLAESELAMSSLRVCFQPGVDDALNCGSCAKCMRTMTGLRVVGALGRCATLPGEFSLWQMAGGPVRSRTSLTYVRENLEAVEMRGADPELAFALRRLVARGARWEAWRETTLLATAARRSVVARVPLLRRALRVARRAAHRVARLVRRRS